MDKLEVVLGYSRETKVELILILKYLFFIYICSHQCLDYSRIHKCLSIPIRLTSTCVSARILLNLILLYFRIAAIQSQNWVTTVL